MAVGVELSSSLPLAHRYAGGTLTVDLPGLASLEGVALDINSSEVRLQLPDQAGRAPTIIVLPEEVQRCTGTAAAKFSKKRGQLTLAWPLDVPAEVPPPAPKDASAAAATPAAAAPAAADTRGVSQAEIAKPPPSAAASPTTPGVTAGSSPATSSTAAAFGSVWNPNSWHWEEKKCLEMVSGEIKKALEHCAGDQLRHLREFDGSGLVIKDIEVKGDASFMLRKGKRILAYEVDVAFKWEAKDEFGSKLGVRGSCEAKGVTQEDDETPEVTVELSSGSCGPKVSDGKAVAGWLKQKGSKILGRCIRGEVIAPAVLDVAAARADHAADAARRSFEKEKAAQARAATGDVQTRMAEEQKRLEAASRQAAVQQAAQPPKAENAASVWNPNAWHWEERPMTKWSKEWLSRELDSLRIKLLGGTAEAKLFSTQVSGDASISIRKGKPIVLFELSVDVKWEAEPGTEGLAIGEAVGVLTVPEFSSEDRPQSTAVEVEVSSDKSNAVLPQAFRREAPKAVRGVLARYAQALREQLPTTGNPAAPSGGS
eukprot:TRINITY_DN7984_c0_g1_i1.p1 TRINITY_DN7984_c0_g1~~TRINITY_DN7984_c0_g1_i1.p1  ORF type:complete len:541 (-),score=162.38 TRINITY_DN7984_c0_g1_i1:271-1893(-)